MRLVRCCRRSLRRRWGGLEWTDRVVDTHEIVSPAFGRRLDDNLNPWCRGKSPVHWRLEGVETWCGGDGRRSHGTDIASLMRILELIEKRFSVYAEMGFLSLDGDRPRLGRRFSFALPRWLLSLGGIGRGAL